VGLNSQEIFMRFSSKGKEIELKGIQGKVSKVISSNNMKKSLKKGHHVVITSLFSPNVQTSRPSGLMDLQKVIDMHSKVFEEIPKGLQPTRDHDHPIHLKPGSVPPKIRHYMYPYL